MPIVDSCINPGCSVYPLFRSVVASRGTSVAFAAAAVDTAAVTDTSVELLVIGHVAGYCQ